MRIATWNGTAFAQVGAGVNGDVFDIAASNNIIYVTGSMSPNRVLGFDGTTWNPVGNSSTITSTMRSIFIDSKNMMYVDGFDTPLYGQTAMIDLNDATPLWKPMAHSIPTPLSWLELDDGTILAGSSNCVYSWNGKDWSFWWTRMSTPASTEGRFLARRGNTLSIMGGFVAQD